MRTRVRPFLLCLSAALASVVAVVGIAPAGAQSTITVGKIEAETMRSLQGYGNVVYSDSTASGGKALKVESNVTNRASITLTGPATELVVRAKTDAGVSAAYMTVAVDGVSFPRTNVAASSWTDYRITGNWTSGSHQVDVTFSNACCRNLYLDVLTFRGAGTATSPTPTPTPTPTTSPTTSPAVTATATPGDGQAVVNWNATNIPDPATAGIWVQRSDGTLGKWYRDLKGSHTFTGLTNGTPVTFEVFVTRDGGANVTQTSVTTTPTASTTPPPATGGTADPANLWNGPHQVEGHLSAHPELQPIADQPAAMWALPETSPSTISGWVSQAAGKTIPLVVYAVPNRDAGLYSAGGFPDRQSYLNYVTSVKNALGSAPAIVVVEPDALGHAHLFDAATQAERVETIKQAAAILNQAPNAEVYIDASMWLSVADQANILEAAGIAGVEGFAVNTSAYNTQQASYDYGNAVVSALAAKGITGKRFVVDSSRNGNGPLTEADRPLANPWLDTDQDWCNPPKRRIGLPPGPVSGQPNVRATLWVKSPGESDGSFPSLSQSSYFGTSAPSAGTFWVPVARDLLGLTPQQ